MDQKLEKQNLKNEIKEEKENINLKYLERILNITEKIVNEAGNQDLKTWLNLKKELNFWKKNFLLKKERLELSSLFYESSEKIDEDILLNLKNRNFLDEKIFYHLKDIEKNLSILRSKENLNSFDQDLINLLEYLKKDIFCILEEKYELKKEKIIFELSIFYKRKINELEKNIDFLEKKEELKSEIEKIKFLEEKELQEYFNFLKENLKSIEYKNNRCFSMLEVCLKDFFIEKFFADNKIKNIDKVINKEYIKEKILSYYNEDKTNLEKYKKEKIFFNELRKEISKFILNNENINKTDLIPSEMINDGLNYLKSFNFISNSANLKFLEELSILENNKKASELLEKIKKVIFETKALLRLFQKRYKDGSLTIIWKAFDKKDKKQIFTNQKLTPELEKIFLEELEKNIELKELLKEENAFPVFYFKKSEDKTDVLIGGIKLKLEKLSNGEMIWIVEKVINVFGLKEGFVSDYEMNNFPIWVKNAAKNYYLIKKR